MSMYMFPSAGMVITEDQIDSITAEVQSFPVYTVKFPNSSTDRVLITEELQAKIIVYLTRKTSGEAEETVEMEAVHSVTIKFNPHQEDLTDSVFVNELSEKTQKILSRRLMALYQYITAEERKHVPPNYDENPIPQLRQPNVEIGRRIETTAEEAEDLKKSIVSLLNKRAEKKIYDKPRDFATFLNKAQRETEALHFLQELRAAMTDAVVPLS